MKKLKIVLPYIALAIAIILQYYVAFNHRVTISQESQANTSNKVYDIENGSTGTEEYDKLIGKVGLAKSINK